MGRLDALWAYQKKDMDVSRHENEMRRDPTRNKLLRLRNFVLNQQKQLTQMEEQAAKARRRIQEIERDCELQREQIDQGQRKIGEDAYSTLEQVQAALREAQALLEGLRAAERELSTVVGNADSAEIKVREIRQQVAHARTQYNTLKEGYDKTFAEQTEKLKALKERRQKAFQGIDSALISRYEAIKKQYTSQPIPQPMAQLMGDQCGGCNMSLPAVVTRKVKDDDSLVECENCGRILYMPGE